MPINTKMLTAIKNLFYPEEDLTKTYKRERLFVDLTHLHILKPFFRIQDETLTLEGHSIPLRIFLPSLKEERYPLIIFFHGGGFVTGNIDSYSKVCTHLAEQTNHIVVSVDYRLAPEHAFPAALEDCYSVMQKILSTPHLMAAVNGDVVLMGDSAGGNLVAACSLLARDQGALTVKKQILLYPLTYHDHSETAPFASIQAFNDCLLTAKRVENYVNLYIQDKKDLTNPYFAPLLATDFSDQPETLIITADTDVLRDEGEAYGKKLREAGNQVVIHRMEDTLHGFFALSPLFPEVKQCYDLINDFLNGEALVNADKK